MNNPLGGNDDQSKKRGVALWLGEQPRHTANIEAPTLDRMLPVRRAAPSYLWSRLQELLGARLCTIAHS
jgi:hypothetical protein